MLERLPPWAQDRRGLLLGAGAALVVIAVVALAYRARQPPIAETKKDDPRAEIAEIRASESPPPQIQHKAIYTYTDDRGTKNFVDDLSGVPAKYRSRVKRMPPPE